MHKRITFVRHAESLFNCDLNNQDLDIGLSCFGRLQASQLQGYYELIILSPLLRAQETYQCSQLTSLQVITNNNLREQKQDPCDWMIQDSNYTTDSESIESVMQRGNDFIDFLKSRSEQNILVISHCEFICSITGHSLYNAESCILQI